MSRRIPRARRAPSTSVLILGGRLSANETCRPPTIRSESYESGRNCRYCCPECGTDKPVRSPPAARGGGVPRSLRLLPHRYRASPRIFDLTLRPCSSRSAFVEPCCHPVDRFTLIPFLSPLTDARRAPRLSRYDEPPALSAVPVLLLMREYSAVALLFVVPALLSCMQGARSTPNAPRCQRRSACGAISA